MEGYIAKYGYVGIFLGTFLEGETTVLLGGIFSKLGYMKLGRVIFWAFLGTFMGDLTFFILGKSFGRNLIDRFEFLRRRIPLANGIIRKYGNFIIFLARFLVGIRALVLLLIGCTDIRISKFLVFNTVNSILWSLLVSLTGYLFGNVMHVFVYDHKKYEGFIVPAIFVLVTLLVLFYRHIVKEKEKVYGD